MSEITLDDTDYSILDLLQREGRMTNAELASRVGLTPAPTLARVNKLQEAGYIEGYVALLDRKGLGLGFSAFVSVIMKSHSAASAEKFLKAVRALPEVLECHHIAGEEDYLLKVATSNVAEFEQLVLTKITAIPDVQRIKTTLILSSPVNRTAIPLRRDQK